MLLFFLDIVCTLLLEQWLLDYFVRPLCALWLLVAGFVGLIPAGIILTKNRYQQPKYTKI